MQYDRQSTKPDYVKIESFLETVKAALSALLDSNRKSDTVYSKLLNLRECTNFFQCLVRVLTERVNIVI